MFVKFVNETQIEPAPTNKGGVFNYHLNEQALRADGYKPLTVEEMPEGITQPEIRYREEADTVVQFYIDTYVAPSMLEPTYAERRAAEYPAIGDQLDAILKGFVAIREGGAELNPETHKLISDWQAIKTKYPKPCDSLKGYDSLETITNEDVQGDSQQVLSTPQSEATNGD